MPDRPLKKPFLALLGLALIHHLTAPVYGGNDAQPFSEPILEAPTLHCLGVYWIIRGDENKNARMEIFYKRAGTEPWLQGMDLFRVEKGGNRLQRGRSAVEVPPDGWLFAGSIVLLNPDTEYELKLQLSDPDGGRGEKLLKARTLAEPMQTHPARILHVVPGTGGGSGTPAEPFKGLAIAQKNARPGDLFLVHAGVYPGTFEVTRSGEPGQPIIWRGAGDGETILDGQGENSTPADRIISASGLHDVWFEKLSIRKGIWGLVAHMTQRVVIRRCHFYDLKRGITATRNLDGRLGGMFIADNLLEGPCRWSDAKHGASVEENRGIEITGTGNIVCYNRVRGFKDGIDMFPSRACVASDVHNNDLSECLDDGCEMDGSERNNRCFHNRLCNVFQGISVQPVYGGPIYIFRNVLYNVEMEVFKMHNSPSGALFFHNTSVKKGLPLGLWTGAKVRHCVTRNNLFIGTEASYAFECDAPMVDCDFDYDGFGGGPFPFFLKWNKTRYKTLADVQAKAPVYRHVIRVAASGLFASGIRAPDDPKKQYETTMLDLRPKPETPELQVGEVLPGFNKGYAGKAPSLGAYEPGTALPHFGPRP